MEPCPEIERLAVLDKYNSDTLIDDPELVRITEFAAALCGAPVALISLVEDVRQRFLARHGIELSETPRDTSFCAQAMVGAEVMVVSDASKDPRFSDNPLVTGDPRIRFYAGAPLHSDDGTPLGALCVIDPQAREGLTDLQRQGLAVLAEAVMRRLHDRRREIAASWAGDSDGFRVLADSMPQIVWSTLPDGFHDYYNARWYDFTGVPAGSTDGEGWNGMFHPDDQERAWTRWRHSLQTGDPYEIEYRLRRADGEYRWTLGRALPMRGPDGSIVRWFGTCTEIHEHKVLLESRDLLSRELGHRIKNIFSLVSALIGLTSRRRPELQDFSCELQERLVALARAHDLVDPLSDSSQASLCKLLDALFEPYSDDHEPLVQIDCERDIDIDSRSATQLALLFHELATNAAKYGALTVAGGRVLVDIKDDDETVRIGWKEIGGPAVTEPKNSGFGSDLITASIERQLGGSISREWSIDGLRIAVEIPKDSL